MNRRKLITGMVASVACGRILGQSLPTPDNLATRPAMNGDQALSALLAGNQRFVSGRTNHPDQKMSRVKELAKTQHPFAAVLGCADSRVDPDIIFDQGLGDLFPVRVAGNIVDDAVLGSLEYAVEHLQCPLIVVLGHEGCGAVTAAVNGGEPGTHITFLVDAIAPALAQAKALPGDLISNTVRLNALGQAALLRTAHPILDQAISTGKAKLVVAIYDVNTGQVRLV